MPLFKGAIRCVEEIARHGSIRRAAEQVHLTPSAVNRQVLKLEKELGAELFERLPRGMRLNAAGELLLAFIQRQKRDLDGTLSQLDALKGLRRGQVRIASLQYLAQTFLVSFLAEFRNNHPGITFVVLPGSSAEVVKAVADDAVDLGLCYRPSSNMPVNQVKSARTRFGVIVKRGHPLSKFRKSGLRIRDCRDFPIAVLTQGMESRTFMDQLDVARWPSHLIAVETSSFSMLIELVKVGIAIGFVSEFDAAFEVRGRSLVFVPLIGASVPKPVLCLVVKSGRILPPVADLVLEHLSRSLESRLLSHSPDR